MAVHSALRCLTPFEVQAYETARLVETSPQVSKIITLRPQGEGRGSKSIWGNFEVMSFST